MSYDPALTRRMWHQLEPVHAVFYYAPEVFAVAGELGFDVETRWPSYFPWRAAPLGPAGPHLVSSAFYSFSPAMVAEHVPAAWSVASPEKVLQARLTAVDRLFTALLGEEIHDPRLAEAATLARQAAEAADVAGRTLAAANLDLPWPDRPHLLLWQAITVIREHRGDGHLVALAHAGLDACEALVSFAAVGAAPAETFASRGWTGEEWAAATERLASRGWLDKAGNATDLGIRRRAEIERRTDELAEAPWRALGEERADRLADLLVPALTAVLNTGLFPQHTTLGIGRIPNPTWETPAES
jgi:hypothetical protein